MFTNAMIHILLQTLLRDAKEKGIIANRDFLKTPSRDSRMPSLIPQNQNFFFTLSCQNDPKSKRGLIKKLLGRLCTSCRAKKTRHGDRHIKTES
jgi:hypothetical protein